MQLATQTVPTSTTTLWAGRAISGLAVLFLLFDGILHVINPPPVVESMVALGYPADLAVGIGVLELICVAVYLFPRTSILGAVLLTGYLGGPVATHVRVGSPLFSVIFPIILGVLLWGGLYLRDDLLRALIPLRR